MNKSPLPWKDVPEDLFPLWVETFNQSKEGVNLLADCPLCSSADRHRYYALLTPKETVISGNKFIGHGSLWEWCSHCRHYVHYSALVPDWWSCSLEIDTMSLTPSPEKLDAAMLK